jgi:hypothetical protein
MAGSTSGCGILLTTRGLLGDGSREKMSGHAAAPGLNRSDSGGHHARDGTTGRKGELTTL